MDGLGRKNLVRLNADGSIDAAWNANVTGNDAKVLTLVYDGSRLLVGGNFESVNGTVHPWLAALDDSGALTAWNPAPNNPVHAIRPDGGFVYIAGSFTTVGTTSQNGLSQLDAASGSIVVPAFGNHIDIRRISGERHRRAHKCLCRRKFRRDLRLDAGWCHPRHFRSTAALNAGTGTFTSWNPPVSSAVNLKAWRPRHNACMSLATSTPSLDKRVQDWRPSTPPLARWSRGHPTFRQQQRRISPSY